MTETTLPTLEREFDFSSRMSAGSRIWEALLRMSFDAGKGDLLCAHVASGSAMHSVTETPIGDVIMQ